jgi:hypothetical protein
MRYLTITLFFLFPCLLFGQSDDVLKAQFKQTEGNGDYAKHYLLKGEHYFIREYHQEDGLKKSIVKVNEFGADVQSSALFMKPNTVLMQIGQRLYLHIYEVVGDNFSSSLIPFTEGLELDEENTINLFKTSLKDKGRFRKYDGDENGLIYIFQGPESSQQQISVVAFDANLKKVLDKKVITPFTSNRFLVGWYLLDNNQNAHMILRGDPLDLKGKKTKFHVVSVYKDDKEEIYRKIEDNDYSLWSPILELKNQRLQFIDSWRIKNKGVQKGIYTGSVSTSTDEELKLNIVPFEDRDLLQFREGKFPFNTHWLHVLDDGSKVYILEIRRYYETYIRSLDMIVVKVNVEEEIEWIKKIPKLYRAANDRKSIAKPGTFLNGNDIVIVLNENSKEWSNGKYKGSKVGARSTYPLETKLSVIQIDANSGDMTRTLVDNTEFGETKVLFTPEYAISISPGRIFIPGVRLEYGPAKYMDYAYYMKGISKAIIELD